MATAYYNEFDHHAAERLEDLIAAGHIAPGDVDRRSIEDVHPDDLKGYTQCHFFAGFGVWSLALRRAGWPDDRSVWTGSCPCQPFSSAGEGAGFDDKRHLWPHFHWLIDQRRPPVVYGEQVASADAGPWLDLVQDDVEALGYAFGAIAFPSAGVGAPHIRDRTYWVANSYGLTRRQGRAIDGRRHPRGDAQSRPGPSGGLVSGLVGDAQRQGLALGQRIARIPRGARGARGADAGQAAERAGLHAGGLGHTDGAELQARDVLAGGSGEGGEGRVDPVFPGGDLGRPGPTNGLWRDADWILCRDGRWRPTEPGASPLAHGLPRSMGQLQPELRRLAEMAGLDSQSLARAKAFRVQSLRGFGNAINAEAARVFIEATM